MTDFLALLCIAVVSFAFGWMMGKIQDKVFSYIEQKRHFYLGQAENSMRLQGMDHLESMMNALNRIIINDQAHENFYKKFGEKEYLKRYN